MIELTFGLTATVREILATDDPKVAVAHARGGAEGPGQVQVDVRMPYAPESLPLKIGDLVEINGKVTEARVTTRVAPASV